jgi:uncharacterized glyoxalase superfamily protein PhnB
MASKTRSKKPTRPRKRPAVQRVPKRRQPESLRLRHISPSITCNDMDKSIAWYRDVLGFTVGERWEEHGRLLGIQMKAGTCDLMLGQDDFAKGRDRKKGEAMRLWFATTQDLEDLVARVKAHHVPLDHELQTLDWGDRAFAITDPDGIKLTIIEA